MLDDKCLVDERRGGAGVHKADTCGMSSGIRMMSTY